VQQLTHPLLARFSNVQLKDRWRTLAKTGRFHNLP
jgi:hypothetical protein